MKSGGKICEFQVAARLKPHIVNPSLVYCRVFCEERFSKQSNGSIHYAYMEVLMRNSKYEFYDRTQSRQHIESPISNGGFGAN